MYYFVYHINTNALYWQEKATLFMNGNKRIDNPRMKIVKCVDAEAHVTLYLWAGNPCITPSNTVVYLIKCVCTSHVSLVGFLRNVIYVSVASEFGYRCLFFSIVWLSRRHTCDFIRRSRRIWLPQIAADTLGDVFRWPWQCGSSIRWRLTIFSTLHHPCSCLLSSLRPHGI